MSKATTQHSDQYLTVRSRIVRLTKPGNNEAAKHLIVRSRIVELAGQPALNDPQQDS